MLAGREILLGVTGGIAAYKAADLASKLVQAQARVSVILTSAAEQFIGATTFEALTGRPVNSGLFSPHEHFQGEHIGLARRAELLIIAPATADFLAKLALGQADDLLSTAALVVTCPVFVAPAMNCEMWAKPAVQRNVTTIKGDGLHVIEPGSGWLSCGEVGAGRMAEPAAILEAIEQVFR
jgi:phosphopantothenoylcysteine decarboxylase